MLTSGYSIIKRKNRLGFLLSIAFALPYVSTELGLSFYSVLLIFMFLYLFSNSLLVFDKSIGILLGFLFLSVSYFFMRSMILPRFYSNFLASAAALENLAQPILVLIVVDYVARHGRNASVNATDKFLDTFIVIVSVLLSANTVIAFLSIGFRDEVSLVLAPFIRGHVWLDSYLNQRYLGVFNQPMEAGLAYGVMFIALTNRAKNFRKAFTFICSTLVLIGGILSLSKVFFLAFFIGAGVVVWRNKRLFVPSLILSSAGVWWLAGRGYVLDLIVLTAGRFSADQGGTLVRLVEYVAKESLWFGTGLPHLGAALDSGYMEYFVYGGLTGLSLFFALQLAILYLAMRAPRSNRKIAIGLTVFAVVANLGAPVFTLNRASIIFWVVTSLVLVNCPKNLIMPTSSLSE